MRLSVVRHQKGSWRKRINTRAPPNEEHCVSKLHGEEEPSRKRRRGSQPLPDGGIVDDDAIMLNPETEGMEMSDTEGKPAPSKTQGEGAFNTLDAMDGEDEWVDESNSDDEDEGVITSVGEAVMRWLNNNHHLGRVLVALVPCVFLLLVFAQSAGHGSTHSTHADINYASHAKGAHALPEFVSTTHGLSLWTRAIVWAAHYDINLIDHSNEVLSDEVTVGRCWPFWGSRGHIAISLSQRVEVKRMRISHVQDGSSTEAIQQAPRDIALWGLRNDSNLATLRLATDFTTAARFPAARSTNVPFFELLGKYTFDAKSSNQWFEVENPNAVSFSAVLVEILTNWGGRSTCVYSIGIYA